VVIRVGIIITMKREDRALSAISAVDSSQTNFTTESGEMKAGCLLAARIAGLRLSRGVGGCVHAVGYFCSWYSPCAWEVLYLSYGCFPYMCAKLFTDQTKFSESTQRKMLRQVEFHHVSPNKRHGTHMGITNANVSTSGAKYLQARRSKLHTTSWKL